MKRVKLHTFITSHRSTSNPPTNSSDPIAQDLLTYGACQNSTLLKEVISHSVPVFWFGNRQAKIATVGINCGTEEFNPHNRLAQHWGQKSGIGMHNFQQHVGQIISHYDRYFTHPNSCQKVFWSKWESLLNMAGASYFKTTMIPTMIPTYHFDLVPWATSENWGQLPAQVQQDFLQISSKGRQHFFQKSSANIFLCQGRTVTETAGPALGFWKSKQSTPWKKVGKSKFVIQKHPTLDKWLIGWNKWYYSTQDRAYVVQQLQGLLAQQVSMI